MPTFWMGDADSQEAVALAEVKIAEGQKLGRYLAEPRENELPPVYEKAGNVGVIKVAGSLVNGSAGWRRLFGVVGYDDLVRGALTAAADPEVDTMVFLVSSSGGHVHGLAEASAIISKLSAQKPSLTYTPDTMASAAYWLGSAVQGPIVMAPTAEVGSLGIMKISRNISKALEMEGVTMTIHRSGDMKARDNPIEELTPEAKAHLDSQLADLHAMFRKHVGARRPAMSAEDLAHATDGRTFLGKRAVEAKLADSLGSFDMALKLLDKHSRKKDTSSNFKGASMNMTPAQQAKYNAAIAGGATVADALIAAGVTATAEQVAEMTQAVADFKAAEDKRIADAAAAKKASDDAAAAAAEAAAGKSADTGVVALLQSQLATSQAAHQAALSELTALKATTQTAQANHEGLLKIARERVAGMLVPMGGSAASAEALDATAIIAEHARVKPLFEAKFPVGQVSKAAEAEDNGDVTANNLPMAFRLRTQQSK